MNDTNRILTASVFFLKRQCDGVLGGKGRISRGDPRQSFTSVFFAVAAVLLYTIKTPGDPRVHLAQQLR